jgi:outer membrane protein TolC
MAYVRGELDVSERELNRALELRPGDLRAAALAASVARELGKDSAQPQADNQALIVDASSPRWNAASIDPQTMLEAVLCRNPEIRRSVYRIMESRAQVREARADIGLEFDLLFRLHPLGFLAGLSQSLLGQASKRGHLINQAQAMMLAELAEYAHIRNTLLDRVLGCYLDYQEAGELRSLLEKTYEIRQDQAQTVEALARFEVVNEDLLISVQRDLDSLRLEMNRLGRARDTAVAELNALMARRVNEPLRIESRSVVVAFPEEVEASLQIGEMNRLDLQRAKMELEVAHADLAISAVELPEVRLRARYGRHDEKGRGEFLKGPSVGLQISTPLLIHPLKSARNSREDALLKQLEVEFQRLMGEVATNIVRTFGEYLTTKEAVGIADRQLRDARDKIRLVGIADRWSDDVDPLLQAKAKTEGTRAVRESIIQHFANQRAVLNLKRALGVQPEEVEFTRPAVTRFDLEAEIPEPGMGDRKALRVDGEIILDDPVERDFIVDFLHIQGINKLFLSLSEVDFDEKSSVLGDFLSQCSEKDLVVYAVLDASGWIRPDQTEALRLMLEKIRLFQQGPSNSRFAGVHFDLQQSALSDWEGGSLGQLLSGYVELLTWVRENRKFGVAFSASFPSAFRDYEISREKPVDGI